MRTHFFLLLAAALLLAATAGCDSDDEEPLPGTYRSTEFRLQTDEGDVVKLESSDDRIEMTLGGDGSAEGRLAVSGAVCALLARQGCEGGEPAEVLLAGSYDRNGYLLTFDFPGSDTFIEDLRWVYNPYDAVIRAETILDDHGVADYVVFLEKQNDEE